MDWISTAQAWLQSQDPRPVGEVLSGIGTAGPDELQQLIAAIVEAAADEAVCKSAPAKTILQFTATRVKQLTEQSHEACVSAAQLMQVYEAFYKEAPIAAAHALQMMSQQALVPDDSARDYLAHLASAIEQHPPSDWQSAALALSPLWSAQTDRLDYFFQALGESYLHASILAVLLDLAAHAVRTHRLPEHPWHDRGPALLGLLAQSITRLERLQRSPTDFGDDVQTVQQVLDEGVALAISLCGTMPMLDVDANDVLAQAMALSHRRIQCEAAAALASTGDDVGKKQLLLLAQDSVSRRRAVAYAEEMGFADEIDEELMLPHMLAESDLAAWLAEPTQFGVAPSSIELLDSRTLYWPSYEEPRNVYLFEFHFNFPGSPIRNVGISGPLTHAFHQDLMDFSSDDKYAVFAGWHVEHEDIFEVPITGLNTVQRAAADRLNKRFTELEYESAKLHSLMLFLGDVALLARASQDGQEYFVIVDENDHVRLKVEDRQRAPDVEILACLYKGRRLLRAFNE